ncbi:MAG: arginine N-succinyltransferase [Bdellovibrionaceae bacterium]|nr:arginine N-succinyltransferase [Pseudobdellovibrionaceae bacterium]MDW8189787.1 arginine N-succinyltransferase [Pseudobdellovibrionaceae bacterium]
MSFRVRRSHLDDLDDIYDLARQFDLLNLPADKKRLLQKLEKSEASFAGELPKEKAEYLFVVEDLEERVAVGCSLIMGKHGTPEVPHNAFKVFKRNHYSEDLGLGFIHQVLQLKVDTDGPTEIGGLLVDKGYRSRPEKLGKLISLARFMFMAERLDQFEDTVLVELTPPLGDDGKSDFWEAVGRRFTGLPYQEADLLSQTHKEFIASLFPSGEIYLCLLDARARASIGRVGEQTKPAQYLLESIGFTYIEEIDPFDGGPHYEAETKKIKVIEQSQKLTVSHWASPAWKDNCLVSYGSGSDFFCISSPVDVRGDTVMLPEKSIQLLGIDFGEMVRVAPFRYRK